MCVGVGVVQRNISTTMCKGILVNMKTHTRKRKHHMQNRFHTYMVVDLNSFVSKRPFFANKKVTFANLSRIHRRALFISRVREAQLLSASVVSEMTSSQLQL